MDVVDELLPLRAGIQPTIVELPLQFKFSLDVSGSPYFIAMSRGVEGNFDDGCGSSSSLAILSNISNSSSFFPGGRMYCRRGMSISISMLGVKILGGAPLPSIIFCDSACGCCCDGG